MAVSSIESILQAAAPEEIAIPGWREGEEITVLVKRPNFYSLLARGAIPNPLIPEMEKLFVRRDRSGHADASAEFAKTLVYIARECLQEPGYDTLQENGISLTDDQLTEISLYATAGAEALRTFRERLRAAAGKHVQAVPDAAEQAGADT